MEYVQPDTILLTVPPRFAYWTAKQIRMIADERELMAAGGAPTPGALGRDPGGPG
jgi:hypothetical protein